MGRPAKLPSVLLLLPLVLGGLLVFFPRRGTTEAAIAGAGMRSLTTSAGLPAEELLFLLQYVGSDYAGAVQQGAVVSEFEYQEMLEFTRVLLEEQARIDANPESAVTAGLARLRALVENKEDPEAVQAQSRELVALMTRELRLVTYPARAPSVERGRALYAVACASCHGPAADGKGASAPGQDPPPTSFREPRMRSIAPHQLYNAIGFGVDATAMPSFDAAYSPDDRWDVAFFLMTLRDDFAPEPPRVASSVTVRELATLSDEELAASHGLSAASLDFYRSAIPETPEDELLRMAQRKLEESHRAFESGDRQAAIRFSMEAYLDGIEPAEATLLSIDARLVRGLERELAQYRAALRDGASAEEIAARLDRLRSLTEEARRSLEGSKVSFGFALIQSAAILLREGIEAALLVALLMTYLAAAGHPELRRYTLGGALAGVLAGLLTWVAAQYLVEASTLQREALEGITSLLAAGVLFSVSFWIIHSADLKRWKTYIEDRARTALGAGSGLALASVSFLAVYREAFETVLFYQALWLRAGDQAGGAIVLGLVGGAAALLVVIVLMFRYGRRIPLKPFFAVTGVILGLLSLAFAGYGVAELQKIAWIQETPLPWVPYVPFIELQPTLEGLSLQLGIFFSFVLSWFLAGSPAQGQLKHARAT
jgi:high-affinity iron transporter